MQAIVRIRTAEDFLRGIIDVWLEIQRWPMQPDSSYENDLMHSFKTALQVFTALSLEKNEEIINKKLELLTLGLLHDVSEACIGGDIAKPQKDDPRLCGVIDEIEKEEFDERFNRKNSPTSVTNFLKKNNHIQGRKDLVEGRFFDGIENLGYLTFALQDIASNISSKNNKDFQEVIKNRKIVLLETVKEFSSIDILCSLLFPKLEHGPWNIEETLRGIIKAWHKSAWPGYPTKETVLERTMKTAILASMLIPREIEKRKGKNQDEQINGFMVLSCALVHNFAKVIMGVWPYRMKTHRNFNIEVVREIEHEKFLEVIKDFPEATRFLMTEAFNIDHNEENINGRFFASIKFLSYSLFALYEYQKGNLEFKDVLVNCLPQLLKYEGEFKSFAEFFVPAKHIIEQIVDGESRIWVEVK